jgi:transcriptional regulator with XRE-family HTH domain
MDMQIGDRIRKERTTRGLSLAQLAKLVGVSKMTLHRVETGKTSPSIALLGDLAQALEKSLTGLLEDETSGFIQIVTKKEQFTFNEGQVTARILLPRQRIKSENGTLAVNYVECTSGGKIESHRNQGMEFVFQFSGTSVFNYDGKEYTARPGDVFFYDGRRLHSVEYRGNNKFILISFK